MAWTLTVGLQNLRSQVNERWPQRDRASDGTIGDAAHQGETSGHNPDDTPGSKAAWTGDPDTLREVRAWDMDSDLGQQGASAQMVVDHVRSLSGVAGVIRYIIFNRTMYHSRDGFAPTAYDGPSPHTEHIHFEGAFTQAADNNTSFDYRLEEVGAMPLTPQDLKDIARAVWNLEVFQTGKSAHNTLFGDMQAGQAGVSAKTDAILKNVVADDGERDQILAAIAAERAAVLAAVGQVDEELLAKLSNPGTPDAQVAAALVSLLGSRKNAVVALMQA